MTNEIAKATQQAMILEKAMKRATTDKGISYYALNSELQKAGTNAAKLTATLAKGGQQFAASLNAANVALAQSDRTLISLSSKIKEMSRVMVQSFKFTAAQATLQAISNAAREAYQWVYDLDKTITNIGVVTGYTGDQLDKVTQNAIAGAKELRIAANDYAEGALIFYQQGLGDDEVARRVEITAKSARAAGQSLEAMSSQLTAIWNTYQMTGDEMERAASVGAKMAGDTAVDFADIAEAMQTAAAPAEQMGVSYNSLAAIIATVGDTTQQSASVIGNAFKTIFSRFQQLKAEGTDGEVTLNRVSSQLQSLGINVLDASGELRNLDTVIMEVGTQWDSWSQKQQLAVAQLVGGTRQYGQFLTLMQNFDKYQDLLQSANAEDGSALEQQYASSLDSIESRAENAGEAWRRAFGSLIDVDMVKGVLSAVETVGNALDEIFEILGDTKGVALYIATIFAKQWTSAIGQAANNLKTLVTNFTPKQRERNINREYDNMNNEINIQKRNTNDPEEKRSLEIQRQKNEFGRQTAIINDKINTSLKTANSSQRIILNQQKQILANSQQQYQNALDRLNVLQQEAEKQQNILSIEEQQALAEERKARAVLQGYQQRLADTQASMPSQAKVQKATNIVQNKQDYSAAEIQKATNILNEYNKKLQECARLQEKIDQASDKVFEASLVTKNAQEITKLQQAYMKAQSEVTKYGLKQTKTLKEARSSTNDFRAILDAATKDSAELQQELAKIPQVTDKTRTKGLERIIAQLVEIAEKAGIATAAMSKLNSEGVDATEDRDSAKSKRDSAGKKTSPAPTEEDNSTPQKIDFSGIVAGTAQAATAIASLGSIWSSTWQTMTSETASGGEKILSLLAAIGLAIPMITSLNTAVVTLGKAFNLVAKEETAANAVTVLANMGRAIATKMTIGQTAATGAATVAHVAETGAITAKSVAMAVLAAIQAVVNKQTLISLGYAALAVAAIAAVVAIIMGLIKLIQWLIQLAHDNSLEGQLEAAKESAEMFASALEDAKTEAEALKSAFDGYEDVKKTLNECAQGTQEWEDALKAVNDQVLQLMADYPELAGMVNEQGEKAITRNETTGELEVADWAMEQMENEANQKVQNTQAASIHANQNVREAELAISKRDAGMSFASNDALTALAENGDVFGLSGEDLTNRIAEIFAKNGINGDAQKYADAISKNTEAAIALAQEVRSNTIATETENDVLGQAALEGTDYEGTDLAMGQAGTQYDAAYDKAYQDAYDRITDRGAFNTGTDTSKEIFQQYADAMGLSDLEDFEVTNYRGDGDVDIKYTDENGDEQTETIKAEDVANFIAGAEAAKNLGTNMEVLDTDVQNLSRGVNDATQANEAAAKAIEDGNVGSLTKEEFDDLKAKATSGEDMSTYLQSQGMSKENADIYGQMLYEQLNQIDWDDALKGIEIPDSALDNFTTAQVQKLGNAYEKIGEIGGEEMQGQIEDIISAADEKGLGDEVAAKLAEVDFTDWDSIEEFQDYLNSIGLDFDALGIDLNEFTEQLQTADGVLRTIDPTTINEKYQEIFDFAEDLDIGDTITEEQFLKLDENMQGFFQDMGDGTYQLTQDAETFLNTVKEAQLNELMNEAEKAQQNYDSAKTASYDTQEDRNAAMETATQDMISTQTAVLGMATTLAEFDAIYAQLAETMGEAGVQLQAKATALTQLASQFDNTSAEVEAYNLAVQNLAKSNSEANREALALAEGNLRVATTLGEAAEKYDLNAEVLETQTREIAKAKGISEEAAATMAVANQRLNKGIQELSENWEDWSKVLKSSDKTTQDYAEALTDLSDAVTEIVGWYEDLNLTSEFVEENMDLIGEAAEGNSTAILQLGAAVAETAVKEAELNQATYDAYGPYTSQAQVVNGTANAFEQLWAKMAAGTTAAEAFASVQNNVAAGFNTISASMAALQNGASLSEVMGGPEDLANWVANLNAYASATQMTAQEMNQMLGSVGVTAKVTTEYQKQTVEVPTYVEHVVPLEPVEVPQGLMSDGEEPKYATYTPVKKYTVPGEPFKTEGYVGVAKIESITPEGGGTAVPDIQFTGKLPPTPSSTGGNTGGNGGGGGSSSKPTKKKKAKPRESLKVEDRYSTTQAAIDKVQRSLDRLDETSSDMWGGPRLAALRKYNKELWQQGENLQAMLALTERYKEEDFTNAQLSQIDAENALGGQIVDIERNEDGFIKNRTEVIESIDALLQKAYDDYYNAAMQFDAAIDKGTATEEMEENVDNLKTHYDELDEAAQDFIADMDLSDETAQKYIDTLNELVELIRTEIANRVETITYRIELQTDMNDLELENLERSIEHLGDVGILTGSKIGLLGEGFGKAQSNAQLASQKFMELTEVLNNLNTEAGQDYFIEKYGQKAWDEYSKEGILPEEIVSGLQDSISDMMSSVDEMYSKMEDMFDTYLDLLDMYADKFDQIADKLSLNASKLDVYQELLEFSGQQYNGRQGQEARKAIADARISTSRTNMELSQAKYDTYKEQYDEWMKQVEDFQRVHGDDIASYDEATAAAWNKIDETRQELYTNMQESEEEIYSNFSELVQNVADAIEVGAQIITEQTVESLDGLFNDFAAMTETWDQMEELRLFFLEDYDKAYQLESLLRDIDDVMQDVTDPEAMNEYLALIDEINAANQEGVDITQTDVDLLKAKFELQKAQDAYEEQMNAKNTMRLARDASGNWNYVYSQDGQQSEDAVQALADAQYNYDKLLHEARDESSQLWLQTQQEFFEWQEQIDQSRLQWDTAYREQVQRTYDYYLALTERYAGQVDKYNNMLGDSYADTTLGIITQYGSMEEAQAAYTQQHAEYNTQLEENTQHYEQVVDEAADEIGIDYDDLATDVYLAAEDIMGQNELLKGDIWDLQSQASSALSAMATDVWSNVDSMIAAIQALEAEIEAALALLRQLTDASTNGNSTGFDANRDYTATGYNAIAGKTYEQAKAYFETEQGQLMAQEWANKVNSGLMQGHNYTVGGKNFAYGDSATSQDFIDAMLEAVKQGVIEGNKYDEGDTSDVSNKVGDQGSWYNDRYGAPRTASGGLIRTPQVRSVAEDGAELILNSTDTQNILDAVRNMREVVKMKMSSMNTNIQKQTEGNAQKTVINKDIQQVDQTVSIDATFPNVSVAAEIEEALNNLINQAVQYATRNNR